VDTMRLNTCAFLVCLYQACGSCGPDMCMYAGITVRMHVLYVHPMHAEIYAYVPVFFVCTCMQKYFLRPFAHASCLVWSCLYVTEHIYIYQHVHVQLAWAISYHTHVHAHTHTIHTFIHIYIAADALRSLLSCMYVCMYGQVIGSRALFASLASQGSTGVRLRKRRL
jgi:hypothetical protein